jgi:hypothetical protein
MLIVIPSLTLPASSSSVIVTSTLEALPKR